MDKTLKWSHDTIKVPEENWSRKNSNIPCSYIFTYMSPRARDMKERINNLDFKIKLSARLKKTSAKRKGNQSYGENILANDFSDKGLISKIYKELSWLHFRKTNNPIKKWAKELNRHFSKEDIQRAHRHVIGCPASLAIREMQIKTTMWYYFPSIRTAIINNSTNNKCWQGCGEKGILVHCWWECRLVQPLWKIVWNFLKILKPNRLLTQQFLCWD